MHLTMILFDLMLVVVVVDTDLLYLLAIGSLH